MFQINLFPVELPLVESHMSQDNPFSVVRPREMVWRIGHPQEKKVSHTTMGGLDMCKIETYVQDHNHSVGRV